MRARHTCLLAVRHVADVALFGLAAAAAPVREADAVGAALPLFLGLLLLLRLDRRLLLRLLRLVPRLLRHRRSAAAARVARRALPLLAGAVTPRARRLEDGDVHLLAAQLRHARDARRHVVRVHVHDRPPLAHLDPPYPVLAPLAKRRLDRAERGQWGQQLDDLELHGVARRVEEAVERLGPRMPGAARS
eukprot:5930557-Prymnesium_polylepis.1